MNFRTPVDPALIAWIAHTACGQKRADKITPYISHPIRVAQLAKEFATYASPFDLSPSTLENIAYLHDVLEDTDLTREDLIDLGVSWVVLDVVERLTKEDPNAPATEAYYQGISESELALVVKCADRCANLEDSLQEVQQNRSLKRWRNYVSKTYSDVLPLYRTFPLLREQIVIRLDAITEALVEASIAA